MTRPEFVFLEHKNMLAEAASARLADLIKEAVTARGVCSMALAGGNTPKAVYAALAKREDVPWDKVQIFFGDERCVPPDHADSNYLMAKESLLEAAGLGDEQVFRMKGELEDREQAAAEYAALLPASLDIVLLGMGPDGHTASLFPGDGALEERERLVVPVFGSKPPPWRLTVTPSVIEGAKTVVVFALGASKADKLREVLTEPRDISLRPIQLAIPGVWFVDTEAAAKLPASLKS